MNKMNRILKYFEIIKIGKSCSEFCILLRKIPEYKACSDRRTNSRENFR